MNDKNILSNSRISLSSEYIHATTVNILECMSQPKDFISFVVYALVLPLLSHYMKKAGIMGFFSSPLNINKICCPRKISSSY